MEKELNTAEDVSNYALEGKGFFESKDKLVRHSFRCLKKARFSSLFDSSIIEDMLIELHKTVYQIAFLDAWFDLRNNEKTYREAVNATLEKSKELIKKQTRNLYTDLIKYINETPGTTIEEYKKNLLEVLLNPQQDEDRS